MTTEDASLNRHLGEDEDGPADDGAVEAVTSAIASVLDRHLTAAQSGKPELGGIRANWVAEEHPKAATFLRSGLTDPSHPVTAARYVLQVQLEPNPTLVTAAVSVDRRDGSTASIEMIFDVTSGRQPYLQLVGGGEVAS